MTDRLRYYLDTEFVEWSGGIDLISIGIVCEDGREFYAEVTDDEIPWDKADPWVLENVRPHLHLQAKSLKKDLALEILSFVSQGAKPPIFWAYFGDYDWVVFCRLFGRMIDLPKGWPMFAMDLKQRAMDLGNPQLPEQTGTEHDVVEDARWNKQAYGFLANLAKQLDRTFET